MFKRLRDRIVEEAKQSPLRMPSMNVGLPGMSTSNTLTNPEAKPASTLPEENQFSITEDDGTSSEMGSPQQSANRDVNSKAALLDTSNDQFLFAFTEMPNHSSYVPPSDLESEVEDTSQSPPMALDESVSKEQLFIGLQRLHARVQKYKSKYSKVALACKEANSEKEKIMRTLSDNQDRALRRLNELKEQCNLEQQAKAHLEENLRVILEEKDQMISVLQTKVQLLKEGQSTEEDKIGEEIVSVESAAGSEKENSSDIQDLQRKVKRLEELLTRCKDALQSNKERSNQLTIERDQLANQLEQKELELQKVQENEVALQARLRGELAVSEESLTALRKEQEEGAMSMAETKRLFHEELEVREQKFSQTQSQLTSLQGDFSNLENKCASQSEQLESLEEKLLATTTSLEKEKDDLVAELSRGKTAALDLLKETQQKQMVDLDEKWTEKYTKLQQSFDELKETTSQIEVENSKLESILAEKQSNEESSFAAKDTLDAELVNLKREIDTLKEKEAGQIRNLENLRETCAQLEDQLNTSTQKKKEDASEISRLKEFSGQLGEELKALSSHKNKLESTIHSLQDQVKYLSETSTKTITEAKEDENILCDKVKKLEEELSVLKHEKNEIVTSKDSLLVEVETLKLEHSVSDQSRNDWEAERNSLNEQKLSLETEIASLKIALKSKEDALTASNELKFSVETENTSLKTALHLNDEETISLKETLKMKDEDLLTKNEFRKTLEAENASLKTALQLDEKEMFAMKADLDESKCKIHSFKQSLASAAKDFISFGSLDSLNSPELISKAFESVKLERQNLLDEVARLENLLHEKDRTLKNFEDTISSLEAQCKSSEEINLEHDQLSLKLSQMEEQAVEKEQIISHIETKFDEANRQLLELQIADEEKIQKVNDLELLLEQRSKMLEEITQTVNDLEEKICELRNSLSDVNGHLQEKEKLCTDLEQQLMEVTSQLEETHSRLESCKSKLISTENELRQSELERSDKEKLRIESEQQVCQQIKDLNAMINAKSEEYRNLEVRCHEFEAVMSELKNESSQKENQLGKMMEQITVIEDLKQHSKNLEEEATRLKSKQEGYFAMENENLRLMKELEDRDSYVQQFNKELKELDACIDFAILETSSKSAFEEFKAPDTDSTNVSVLNSKLSFHMEYLKKLKTRCDILLEKNDSLEGDKEELSLKLEFEKQERMKVVHELESKLAALETQVTELTFKISELTVENQSFLNQNQNLQNDLCNLKMQNTATVTGLEEQLNKSKLQGETIPVLEAELTWHKSELSTKMLLMSEKDTALAESEEKLVAAQDSISEMSETCMQLQQRCGELENEVAAFENFKEKIELLETEKNEMEGHLSDRDSLMSSIEEFKNELGIKSNIISGLETAMENLKQELSQAHLNKEEFEQLTEQENKGTDATVELLRKEMNEEKALHEAEIAQLTEKHNFEVLRLHEELKTRDSQLDESLIVAEANTSDIVHGLEHAKSELSKSFQEREELKSRLSEVELECKAIKDELKITRKTFEEERKEKDEDLDRRVKQLVKDFSQEMHQKDEDHDKAMRETIEKYHDLEQKLDYTKDSAFSALEKNLTEQSTAMEEMREHFLAELKEKEEMIAKLKPEGSKLDSDWDNAWEEEPEVEPDTVKASRIEDVGSQINNFSIQNTDLSYNSNNIIYSNSSANHDDKIDTVLEPTEFEYLRNILMEYMMGKEPLTLAKVIAAVLRFPEQQTNEILQREEARAAATV